VELGDEPATAPMEFRNDCGLGGWMFEIAFDTVADPGVRKPIPSGWGMTIPIPAASRSIR
jgi:hypothetical protein